jgi:hypothetical protein
MLVMQGSGDSDLMGPGRTASSNVSYVDYAALGYQRAYHRLLIPNATAPAPGGGLQQW